MNTCTLAMIRYVCCMCVCVRDACMNVRVCVGVWERERKRVCITYKTLQNVVQRAYQAERTNSLKSTFTSNWANSPMSITFLRPCLKIQNWPTFYTYSICGVIGRILALNSEIRRGFDFWLDFMQKYNLINSSKHTMINAPTDVSDLKKDC